MKRRFHKSVIYGSMIAAGCILSAPALAQSGTKAPTVYIAHLTGLNNNVTGQDATGLARLEVDGNKLSITLIMQGVPANTIHWQHFHGFKDGRPATCATEADDANGDGIVDLMETSKASGTTMVPFDTKPAAMDVAHGTYPKATADGSYSYHEVVPLKKLRKAFAAAFKGQKLQLDHRVIYIHGVPSSTKLPSSVASLGPIPASVTLPIACGKIELAK